MTNADETIIDFSSTPDKARLWALLRSLEGKHRISICRYRGRRSDRQNRYYWPCFVVPLARKLREQQVITDSTVHELLKSKFLKQSVVCPTGEVIDVTRSTTDLTTEEFNIYLDHCAEWLADFFDIIVPSPSVYHERTEEKTNAKQNRKAVLQ